MTHSTLGTLRRGCSEPPRRCRALSRSPQELIAHCKERMAAYKYPRQVELIDELPKTVTGEILRRELRDQGT